MIIRKEQFSRYLQEDEEGFISLICRHLREENEDLIEHISDDTLREMVNNGLTRARRYVNTDEDLMAFVSVMMEIAPNFDEHPALHQVLTDPTIPVNSRFDALFNPALGRAWEGAKQKYDQKAWFRELNSNLMN